MYANESISRVGNVLNDVSVRNLTSIFNLRAQEAKAGGSLGIHDQLHHMVSSRTSEAIQRDPVTKTKEKPSQKQKKNPVYAR